MRRQIDHPAAHPDMKRRQMFADRLDRIGDLAFRALLQFVEEAVAHRRGVKSGRAEMVQIDVGLAQGQQLALPHVRNRAFLGHQRAGPELEGDRAELGIVDPIAPLAQIPQPARHEDRGRGEPELDHQIAQLAHPRIWRLGTLRVLAVGQPVMAAGEPRILIDDAAEPVAEFVVGAFPQCPERPARGHDRIIVDAIAGADLGDLVGHAGAAGDAVDQAAGAFEHAVQNPLGGRHLPQNVHVDAAFAVAAFMGDAGLLDAAGDRIGDQLFVPLAPGASVIDLGDQPTVVAITVGIDPGERADTAGCRPRPGALAVRHRDALAAFDERQRLAPGDDQRIERLHPTAP